MPSRRPARTTARARSTIVATLVVAALLAVVGYRSLAPTSLSSAPEPRTSRRPPTGSPAPETLSASASASPVPMATEPPARPPADTRPRDPGPRGAADGAVPDGVTVFDGAIPAVANLDPGLLGALRRAATDASGDGVELLVTSGWRSPAYQEQLLGEAVSSYGSEAEAARWVATPERSQHVSGDAIDLGTAAAAWLSGHGDAYGLCQIYDNEPWHYELRPDAVEHGCPARYADPTHDPRLQP